MECFYINVEAAAERRRVIEENFHTYKVPGWFLSRTRAVDLNDLAGVAIRGRIREVEKACHMSHRNAVEESIGAPGHALILEDDTAFGPRSCAAIERAVASLPEDDWDLLFADAMIGDPVLMTRLLMMRRELEPLGRQVLLPLTEWPHAGAAAYIINQRFKERLRALVNIAPLDLPYDILLREYVMRGEIRAFLVVPFPLMPGIQGDESQIQPVQGIETDIIWNGFRRLMALDRDLGSARALIARLPDDFIDDESAIFARVLGASLSNKRVMK
ncbi:MAG TPA: glycosyltransferase family 25 protein [Burkholderiales bacterium]|jgi:GR25 family glycosyltransferase involved in LPS biosynthesis